MVNVLPPLHRWNPLPHLVVDSNFANEFLIMFSGDEEINNAKKILGVTDQNNIYEVKQRYRLMVKRFHPDISPLSEDYDKFILIQNAYNTLIASKKAVFGTFRETYPKKGDTGFQVMDFENISNIDKVFRSN